MTGLPCLSLHAPYGSLMALGVKNPETRSWPAPKHLIGQRMGIHAAKRRPTWESIGDYEVEPWFDEVNHVEDCYCEPDGIDVPCARRSKSRDVLTRTENLVSDLPLGCIVVTGVLVGCAPIGGPYSFRTGIVEGDEGDFPGQPVVVLHDDGVLILSTADGRSVDITDQLPYGDYRPGRWAWLYEAVKPTTERCPACWGDGDMWTGQTRTWLGRCPTCKGAGHCDPVPAKGKQGIWRWSP